MQRRPLILIVDDDVALIRAISRSLAHEGFATRHAMTGDEALRQAREGRAPDAAVLDLVLPDMSGLDVLKALRNHAATRSLPVVFLTGSDNEQDRVQALEHGADDYMVKPCSMRVLALRLRALLRRSMPAPGSTEPSIQAEGIHVDADAHRVWVDGGEIALTALEFRLLKTLVERPGRVQSRARLLQDVWGFEGELSTRTVDTRMRLLRARLGPWGASIETIRGVGYRFSPLRRKPT